jgi:hypothetical protein
MALSQPGWRWRVLFEGGRQSRVGGYTRAQLGFCDPTRPGDQGIQGRCPPDGEWLAIRFRPGTFLPQLPTALLINHNDLNCPTSGDRFWFAGRTWEIPSFGNAEAFVGHLARLGIIARDGAVSAVVSGDPQPLTVRSVQRHFLRTTGMTHGQFRQIERARQAVDLLRNGSSILDVVDTAGYFDQAHLTRSLKHLIGLTPGKLSRGDDQLSFSYKTTRSARI